MKKVFLAIVFVASLGLVGCENDNINDEIYKVDPNEVERPGDQGGE